VSDRTPHLHTALKQRCQRQPKVFSNESDCVNQRDVVWHVKAMCRYDSRERVSLYRKPEAGVRYLVAGQFVDDRPSSVARFLLTRKGLSKQMIGDYLGNLQRSFNMEVLRC